MSNEMAIYSFSDMQSMAEAVARSGLFGMKNADQALALMLVAQSENQHPATITQDYDIIQGKACRKTHSVMARFQQMGGKVEWHQLTDAVADATFSHPSGGDLRIAWTFEQAKKAGLTGKDNWKNYPRAMLRARCIAEGIRAVYPSAIGGMMVSEEATDVLEKEINPKANSSQHLDRPPEFYPADQFETNLPKWASLIVDGKKTAAQIIATVQAKIPLTDEQKATIESIKKAEAPALTFAQVADMINRATDAETLDLAADMIGEVEDPAQRGELTEMVQTRKGEF